MSILDFLRLPYMNEMDLDDPKTTALRIKIIKEKIFLKSLYTTFYTIFKASLNGLPRKRKLVELGSGAGFIKEIIPGVVTSDVFKIPNIDLVFSATHMPFKNGSVDRFFMLNVIHHIQDPQVFFEEVDRSLKKNGKLVAIEPANTMWGRFIYKNIHKDEKFNPKAGWKLRSKKPLSDANGAIPWIILVRDRRKFEKLFPRLKIIKISAHAPIKYLVSGGVSFRQLLPGWMYPAVELIEKLATPLNNYVGMFYTIEIEKK